MKTKKRFHKLTAWLLTLAMLMTFIPGFTLGVSAETISGTTGDCIWTFDSSTGTLTISGNGTVGNEQMWIEYMDSIISIVIEDGITSIDNYAFYECTSLKSATLPASLKKIGNYAFTDCSKLESVTIPATVSTIGNSVFYGCSSLATVNYLGTSEPSIGSYVFIGCSLTHVTVSEAYTGSTFGGMPVVKSGSSTPTTYTVTITDDGNGTASANPTSGEEGTEVSLTANPKEGYKFKEWQVLSGDVTVTDNKFAIGTANVEIKAVFESEPVATVTKDGNTIGSFNTLQEAVAEATKEENAGSTVMMLQNVDLGTSLTITSGKFTLDLNGFLLSNTAGSCIALHTADLTVVDSGTDGRIEAKNSGIFVSNASAKLTMKSGTVSSTDNYSVSTSNGTANIDGGSVSGKKGIHAFFATINITGGSILGTDGPGICVASGTVNISGGTISGSDYALIANDGTTTITGGNFEGGTDDISRSSPARLTLGYDETTGVGASFPGGIKVSNTTLNTIIGTDASYWHNSAQVELTTEQTAIAGGDVIVKKMMPTHKITIADGIENGTVEVGKKTAAEGASVTLTVTPATGYEIDTVKYNDTVITASNGVYSFTMPAGDVVVTVTFKPQPHTHEWIYKLDGTYTIKATCSNTDGNCDNPDGGSVTIAAPASLDYTGNAIEAVVTNNLTTGDTVEVAYTAASGSELTEGKPVKVGTYTASITLGEATARAEYSITPAPVVTSIDFNHDSLAYNAVTKTFYVSEDFEFVLKITGENLTMFNEKGGLKALFKQEKSGGWAIINVTIESETSAYANVDPFALTGILNDGLNSSKATAVKLENNGNQIGETINVNLEHAPTFKLTINNDENGYAQHNKTSSFIAKYSNVIITVHPNTGYELDRLIVDNVDVTAFVTNNEYAFIMPEKPIEVSVDFKALPHTHDWKFAASGNVITATCEGTLGMCPNPTSTITLVAPENLVYNGSEKVVTTNGTIDGVTVPDVQYNGNRENAGTFTAKLTIDDTTATLAVTITPKSISSAVIALDSNANIVYTGNAITPNVTSVTLDGTTLIKDTDYTVSYSDNTNAGQATVTVTGKGNYKDAANTNFTITKATPVVTAPTAKTGLIYTGQAQELINAGSTTGGTMKYFIGGTQATETVPTRTAAGEYTVTCIVAGDENHNDIVVGEYTVTIAKKTIDSSIILTAPVKNATPQTEITGSGYTATVAWSPDVTEKFSYNTEYTATITIAVDENHTVTGIASNGYTVEGAKEVTNDENSNVVTVAYEKTGSKSSGGGGATRYTVSFDTDGGSNVANKMVTRNGKVAEPTIPTKDGYTFNGWYTDKELTEKYDFDKAVTKSFTLYAKWDKLDDETDEPDNTGSHNCPSKEFDDLNVNAWYHLDIDFVIENGIFKGVSETEFAPNNKLTRAMLVTVLYRVEGEPATNRSIPFADVDMGTYYGNAVSWAHQNGIVKGVSETEFAPDNNITREQIAAIMHRYAQYKGIDVSIGENTNILSYNDFDDISEYAIASMQWAVGSGLIKGKSESTLNPLDNATRAEVAAILHRFIGANKK